MVAIPGYSILLFEPRLQAHNGATRASFRLLARIHGMSGVVPWDGVILSWARIAWLSAFARVVRTWHSLVAWQDTCGNSAQVSVCTTCSGCTTLRRNSSAWPRVPRRQHLGLCFQGQFRSRRLCIRFDIVAN